MNLYSHLGLDLNQLNSQSLPLKFKNNLYYLNNLSDER